MKHANVYIKIKSFPLEVRLSSNVKVMCQNIAGERISKQQQFKG
jgi:hypothetical protein